MEELLLKDWSTINQHGYIECKLCNIDHKTEESYKNHINGKRHWYRLRFLLNRKTKAQAEPKWKTNTENPDTTKSKISSSSTIENNLSDDIDVETLELYNKDSNTLKICLLIKWFISDGQLEIDKPEYSFIGSYEQNIEKKEGNKMYLILRLKGYQNIAIKFDKYKIDLDNLYYNWDKEKLELLFCFDLDLNT